MKHLIIVNTHAGNGKDTAALAEKAFEGLDYQIYETVDQRSAVSFLQSYFKKNKKEVTRVYACGTGNDFAKVYGGQEKFNDFKKLSTWEAKPIDLTKLEGESLKEPWYSINVINFGFDAIVGAKGNENKKKGIKKPYGFMHAIVPAMIHGRFNKIVVSADGVPMNEKKLLLSSIAQGRFVGGEYQASPHSDNTDGLMDVIVLKTMSLMRLLIQYFGKYHDGKHLDDEKLMKRIVYKRAKEVTIVAPEEIDLCVDGEMIRGKEFKCTICPGAIKFVVPQE